MHTINGRVIIALLVDVQGRRFWKLFIGKITHELDFERRVGVCLLGKQRWKKHSWQKRQGMQRQDSMKYPGIFEELQVMQFCVV